MAKTIDLNCDMGESFGAWNMGNDERIMPFVSSVNIACGFHAGDPATITKTIRLASGHGVAIGAHPSYPDLQGFGRREMSLTPSEVYQTVAYQVAALDGMCRANGVKLHHVKPHGALYNRAAKDVAIAAAIAEAVRATDPSLVFYGLSGSYLVAEAKRVGLDTASEVFSDRTYQNDGSLTPRGEDNALISSTDSAVLQVLEMVNKGTVTAVSGDSVELYADTVCIHGDGPNALEFARAIRQGLETQGIAVASI